MKKFMLGHGRPDKPVPCPRCQSLNTKFCYFNNYNVKQPRHFCRECQRYWTAGGSLRNVPVGAGRRKHKVYPSSSSSSSTKMDGIIEAAGCDVEVYPMKPGHTVSFNGFLACAGQDQQQLESLSHMKSVDRMVSDNSMFTEEDVGFELGLSVVACDNESNESKGSSSHDHAHDKELPSSDPRAGQVLPACTHGAKQEESACCCPITTVIASSIPEAASEANYGASPWAPIMGKSSSFDSLPAWWAPLMWPWLLPFWFTGGNGVPTVGNMPHMDPKIGPQVDPAYTSALGAMVKTMSDADPTASILQCPFLWNPFAWGSPWNAENMSSAPSIHSSGHMHEKQGSLCVPKTLRMNHMDDAAYSSILSTLGVGTVSASPMRNGFFNAFQPKADVFQPKTVCHEHSECLGHQSSHINPAAQARSVAFQEGS